METTFILDDATKAQLTTDDLTGVPQIVGADGVTYRVVVAQGDSTAGTDGASLQLVQGNGVSFQNGEVQTAAAPIYVMMNEPTEISGASSRIIVPPKPLQGPRVAKTARDEKRRATHNEVERRRRDKINLWIMRLSRIIPDCHSGDVVTSASAAKTQTLQSKGGILSKACDYIAELKEKSDKFDELSKENERLQTEINDMRHKYEVTAQENAVFREALAQAGLHINVMRADPDVDTSTNPSSATFVDECAIDD